MADLPVALEVDERTDRILDRYPVIARRREGRYLLRTNLTEDDPAKLWNLYLLLRAAFQIVLKRRPDFLSMASGRVQVVRRQPGFALTSVGP